MDQLAAKAHDENKLDQVIDHQTEETVQIFANKQWWIKSGMCLGTAPRDGIRKM